MPYNHNTNTHSTTCESCGARIILTIHDADGILIGGECKCGDYITRYLPGQEPL